MLTEVYNENQDNWTLVAWVDTRPEEGPRRSTWRDGGRFAGGALSRYRHLLFDISRTDDQGSRRTIRFEPPRPDVEFRDGIHCGLVAGSTKTFQAGLQHGF